MWNRIAWTLLGLSSVSVAAGLVLLLLEATAVPGVLASTGTFAGWMMAGGVMSGAVVGIFTLLP